MGRRTITLTPDPTAESNAKKIKALESRIQLLEAVIKELQR
jgi:hypothetical protein